MKHSSLALVLATLTTFGATGCVVEQSPADPAAGGPGGGSSSEPLTCGSAELFSANHEVCDAMDVAAADPNCFCAMGFYWDGAQCTMLTGCSCTGADCDKLAQTEQECLENHAPCNEPPISCGDELTREPHESCEPMDAAAQGECFCALGFAWNGSECTFLGGCQCVGADCSKLSETRTECEAQHASCEAPSFACGSSALFQNVHDECGPMDATGDDQCNCALGFAWNGSDCEAIFGCECHGADCDKLTQDFAQCEADHAQCSGVPVISCGASEMHAYVHELCEPMDVALVGQCYCMLGWVWDGEACAPFAGGCECVGYDCDKVTETQEECEQDHASC